MTQIIARRPLREILESLVELIEGAAQLSRGSIALLSSNGKKLNTPIAPNLPNQYSHAVTGLEIGPCVGSCGTAAYFGKRIVVEDIYKSSLWAPYLEIAELGSIRACWSQPIIGAKEKVLGTFALYYHDTQRPSEEGIKLIEEASHLAALAIEHAHAQEYLDRSAILFEHIPIAIAVTDENLVITRVNPALCSLTCLTQEALIGHPLTEAIHWSTDVYRHLIRPPDNERHTVCELEYTNSQQQHFYLEVKGMSIRCSDHLPLENVFLFENISSRKEQESIVEQQANYDFLTRLPNRHNLQSRVDWLISLCERTKKKFAIFVLDLDHFKEVNDSLGHLAGDQLLCQVGERINAHVRASDTFARLGGDEFALLMTDYEEINDALNHLADKIIQTFHKPFLLENDAKIKVSTSIGVAIYPHDGHTFTELLSAADQALYQSKESGRNNWRLFSSDLLEQAQKNAWILQQLHQAISQNEFSIHYQPIVSQQKSGQICFVEALLRWQTEDRTVAPEEFIPIAERYGLMRDIGRWVREQVFRQIQCWQQAGIHIPVSINLSASETCHETLVEDWKNSLSRFNLSASSVIIEITESLLLKSSKGINVIHDLDQLGFSIAIDDFGSGYSSLSAILDFPVNAIKLDSSFLKNMDQSQRSLAVVESVIQLCNQLDIALTIEGVESQQQYDFLDTTFPLYRYSLQGYAIAQPMNIEDLNTWIQSRYPSSSFSSSQQ
ncbi:bifunctional diguanylate cyclase/phosphodiesterase [Marinibactrum halimedae]|uniref:Bifunctional diguanylate cyclase/phosphodiesterase n=2 Tax=Marinibactrum halimedae TaxID=1444977 RepID=A0AA37T8I3_9GAMM|nr:bifunctional diguanylate cyclase/phosphodiesterase [Marinibactrum halimedae]